tara:strand:+ start:1409 stop:1942 length:534 start_codon:yes stop_codon:yes gene_type:complete
MFNYVKVMEKKIEIKGSSNIKKIIPEQYDNIRKESHTWNISEDYLDPTKQQDIVNKLYLEEFEKKQFLMNMIKKKLSSYKQQDIKNCIYGEKFFIPLEDTVQKLVECKMKCYYCNKNMVLLYKEIKDPIQWTLDRIDNTMGHNTDNVVISCLQCNLKRRNTNMKKFLFTKNLVLIKK